MITARELWGALCHCADILVPRFVDDEMACNDLGGDEYELLELGAVEPGERFDCIITVRSFNLFGYGLFPKQIGEGRPFVNPHDEHHAG